MCSPSGTGEGGFRDGKLKLVVAVFQIVYSVFELADFIFFIGDFFLEFVDFFLEVGDTFFFFFYLAFVAGFFLIGRSAGGKNDDQTCYNGEFCFHES